MDFVKLLNTIDTIAQKKPVLNESSKKHEVDEEKTEEGNAVTGGLADPDVEVGEKIPGTDVVKKKHITTEAKDKDDDDEKESDQDGKETIEESELKEKAAPGQEDWIKSNKDKFIKQYGKKKGMEVLYATSWKRSKKKDESKSLEECYGQAMMGGEQEQESGMNINASTDTRTGSKSLTVTAQGQAAEQLAQLLKLSGLGSGRAPEQEPMGEEYANEPHPETQSVEVQMQQGNDMHRPKNSYPKVSGGDNPMAMREARELAEIEQRLNEELAAFKVVAEGVGPKLGGTQMKVDNLFYDGNLENYRQLQTFIQDFGNTAQQFQQGMSKGYWSIQSQKGDFVGGDAPGYIITAKNPMYYKTFLTLLSKVPNYKMYSVHVSENTVGVAEGVGPKLGGIQKKVNDLFHDSNLENYKALQTFIQDFGNQAQKFKQGMQQGYWTAEYQGGHRGAGFDFSGGDAPGYTVTVKNPMYYKTFLGLMSRLPNYEFNRVHVFEGITEAKGKKPDFLDVDKDGNKKEPMKKALADKGKVKAKK